MIRYSLICGTYKFIQPFFSNLLTVANVLQGGKARNIRIGASTIVLRDHLPELCQRVRKKFPNLKISLREGYQAELEAMMQREELDLAVTLIEKKAAPGIHTVPLVELPMVLMVEKGSPINSADQLWKRDRIDDALICLPSQEGLCKKFQDGLTKLGVDWFPSIEVSSVDLIATYVLNGFGIGVSVLAPGTQLPPGIKALPLHGPEFSPIHSFAVFATGRAYDQLRNSICIPRLKVRIGGSSCGLSDFGDGKTHQSVEDGTLMRALPFMTVLSPVDGLETAKMMECLIDWPGPAYIRINLSDLPMLYPADEPYHIGKITRLRQGSDVALLAAGVMVGRSLEAATLLSGKGVEAGVYNISTLKPLDAEALIRAVAGVRAMVVAEEHNLIGGLGSDVLEALRGIPHPPVELVDRRSPNRNVHGRLHLKRPPPPTGGQASWFPAFLPYGIRDGS